MLKPNTKIGIVYSGNTKKYADELKKIITSYRENGYCIDYIIVDEDVVDPNRAIDVRVFTNLDKCDYAVVFLSKDLNLDDKIYKSISRPNVLIELGYLRAHLNENSIWCIIDFPYQDVVQNSYMFPSDIPATVLEEIDGKNSFNTLKTIFDKFVKTNEGHITKLNNYNVNDLVSSLILNSKYQTDYKTLFSENQLNFIEKYSEKWQLEEVFEIWEKEKSMLNGLEQIIYLFERIVFFPFFPDKILEKKLCEFLVIKTDDNSDYVYACRKILSSIREYEEYKRKKKQTINPEFFFKKAKEIQKELQTFTNKELAPIIECVAKNYIGLSYLNFYFSENLLEKTKKDYSNILEMAKDNFICVIDLSKYKLGDSLEVFQAFAEYNLARVNKELGTDADSEYLMALEKRKHLFTSSSFPSIFRKIFLLERIHTEIDYSDYMKKRKQIDSQDYKKKMNELNEELQAVKQTPVIDISLFKTLEDKLKDRLRN